MSLKIEYDPYHGHIEPDAFWFKYIEDQIKSYKTKHLIHDQVIKVGSFIAIDIFRLCVKRGLIDHLDVAIITQLGHSYIGKNGEVEDCSIYDEIRLYDDILTELIN